MAEAELSYQAGIEALKQSDLGGAETAFRAALDSDPKHDNALYRLGEIALARGESGNALETFRAVLAINPEHAGAMKQVAALDAAEGEQPLLAVEPAEKGIYGIVTNLTTRNEVNANTKTSKTVMMFRLDRRDDNETGQARPPLAVTMRGHAYTSSIQNGDWVQLPKGWKQGRDVTQVTNLTTGDIVATQSTGTFSTVLGWIIGLLAAAWILGIVAKGMS